METIGDRIKYARKKKGLTQTDIKEKTGISSGNLSDIENNKSFPSAQALISLKRELGVTIDWILTGEEPVQKEQPPKYLPEKVGPLTEQEKKIIWMYQQLNPQDKVYVNDTVEMLYTKALKKGTLSGSTTGGTGEEAAASETA